MAASFDTRAQTSKPGPARLLVEGDFSGTVNWGLRFDAGADGRFLVIVQDAPPPPIREYHVVLNWFEELKRLVPTS